MSNNAVKIKLDDNKLIKSDDELNTKNKFISNYDDILKCFGDIKTKPPILNSEVKIIMNSEIKHAENSKIDTFKYDIPNFERYKLAPMIYEPIDYDEIYKEALKNII